MARDDSGKTFELIRRFDWLDVVYAEKLVRDNLLDPLFASSWSALNRLLNRSYWRRGWIVQEITRADIAGRLVCGFDIAMGISLYIMIFALAVQSLSLGAGEVWRAWWRARLDAALPKAIGNMLFKKERQKRVKVFEIGNKFLGSSDLHAANAIIILPTIASVSGHVGSFVTGSLDLLQLLAHFRRSRTSDPRDKIYSLISIAKPWPSGKKFEVDYRSLWQEVYHRLTVEIIQETKSLKILIYAGGLSSGLASWVPN